MKNNYRQIISYINIILVAILLALNYHIFIVENHFAPAGLNGIATMVQYKTGFSISYMSLIINIPLCLAAYFLVEREFAIKTLLFSLVYSFAFLLLQNSGTEFLQYNAQGHDTIFPVIISGVISGFVYGVCMQNDSSTGGTDFIIAAIAKANPKLSFGMLAFLIDSTVIIASAFVFGEIQAVVYGAVYTVVTSVALDATTAVLKRIGVQTV